jgi:hypothetical protein
MLNVKVAKTTAKNNKRKESNVDAPSHADPAAAAAELAELIASLKNDELDPLLVPASIKNTTSVEKSTTVPPGKKTKTKEKAPPKRKVKATPITKSATQSDTQSPASAASKARRLTAKFRIDSNDENKDASVAQTVASTSAPNADETNTPMEEEAGPSLPTAIIPEPIDEVTKSTDNVKVRCNIIVG